MGIYKNAIIELDYFLKGISKEERKKRYNFYFNMYLANCASNEKWNYRKFDSFSDYLNANMFFLKKEWLRTGGVIEKEYYNF